MKQLIQNLKTGNTTLEEIPLPHIKPGHVLIKTHCSLVSTGTEKMLVEFGKANIISKARQQPERVKQVLDKIKSDGVLPTLETIFNKLDEPLPLGYCNAGEIIAVANDVTDYKIGDRVASNGHHAEYVCVPINLIAKIPDTVTYNEAAFTVIGAIGLQGIRLINAEIGCTVVVIGLGLIGLLTAQLLKASGCNVIAFDINTTKILCANKLNISAFNTSEVDAVKIVEAETNGVGCDAVIITASAKNNDIISDAAHMCRKRGKIVLVGVVGLDINRDDFYKKELTFQVSCSYGPGRYDHAYEYQGIDYPLPYVRWTEKRNFEAVLNAISKKYIDVNTLITEKVEFTEYNKIYSNLNNDSSIASLLLYSSIEHRDTLITIANKKFNSAKGIIAIIGAGNYTKMTLLPVLKSLNAQIKYIASSDGVSSTALAKKYNIPNATTDYTHILSDPEIDMVFITTRHESHADIALACMQHGKHVFVEKPLAITENQVQTIEQYYTSVNNLLFMVGFNRRFSPCAQKAKEVIKNDNQVNIIITVNAGTLDKSHWLQDIITGGGRIIGEACHFFDLISFFTGSYIESVYAESSDNKTVNTENAIITLKYKNGAQGAIHYFSNGNRSYAKERIEIYSQGKTLIIDNFKKMQGYGTNARHSGKQDKGHKRQFELILKNLKTGGENLIPFESILNTTRATFAAVESISEKKVVIIK